MTKKVKAVKRRPIKLAKVKTAFQKKRKEFSFLPILPHLIIIAVCVGLYYAMIHYYLFFEWGIYIYYLLKVIIAFEILSSSFRSPLISGGGLLLGLLILFTNCFYLNTLLDRNTAWELLAVSLLGILINLFRARSNIK